MAQDWQKHERLWTLWRVWDCRNRSPGPRLITLSIPPERWTQTSLVPPGKMAPTPLVFPRRVALTPVGSNFFLLLYSDRKQECIYQPPELEAHQEWRSHFCCKVQHSRVFMWRTHIERNRVSSSGPSLFFWLKLQRKLFLMSSSFLQKKPSGTGHLCWRLRENSCDHLCPVPTPQELWKEKWFTLTRGAF